MKEHVSIQDIAREAGVSAATVSRVINKSGRYSKETEEKVMSVIREWEYVPNQIAKGLRKQRTMNVGIIVPDITNEFFVQLVYEIEKNLFHRGYQSFLCNTDEDDMQEKERVQMMANQNVCGLVYLSSQNPEDSASNSRGIPSIYIDRLPERAPKNCFMLSSDNVQGGYLAARELLDYGCRKMLILTSRRRVSSYEDRLTGFRKALAEAGLGEDALHLEYLDRLHYQEAYEAIDELIQRGEFTYDGLFAASDWLALGSYRALRDHGFQVPDQVKIMGFDDISVTAFNTVPISSIHQQVDLLGKTAVDRLVDAIEGVKSSGQVTYVPVYAVPRESTRGCDPKRDAWVRQRSAEGTQNR